MLQAALLHTFPGINHWSILLFKAPLLNGHAQALIIQSPSVM